MKKYTVKLLMVALFVSILLLQMTGCTTTTNNTIESVGEEMMNTKKTTTLPKEVIEIPQSYFESTNDGGTLVNLNYTTYESFTYEEKTNQLEKRAVVYLPKGYSEDKQYNVLYLMHGGWSNETTYMGSPENGAHDFKFVMDLAIANGDVEEMIVVLPTYNNTSQSDSDDYSLAIQLTENYHNELINDLIPAVIDNFSTYAKDHSYESIVASRDHRAFAGFSMGSVQTWRTFQYNLSAFRYFMPSSGNVGYSPDTYAQMVIDQGYTKDDFFIFAETGTDDFAYRSFQNQIQSMATHDMFTLATDENGGNLYYLEKEGYAHDGIAAMTYFYTALNWLWKGEEVQENQTQAFTLNSTVQDVINHPSFQDFGELLFPVDRPIDYSSTLEEISSSSTYLWYSNIQPDKTVDIINYLNSESQSGKQIFYPIYSEEEMEEDPSKRNTGLFFFRGEENAPFAIMNAGGGFYYVGAMHDSFPHALEVSKQGYNAFALIYRPDDPYTDLAQAIMYIIDHHETLGVQPYQYSLWGGSAGARMAATLGNRDAINRLTQRSDIPQASAVIMQYTGYTYVSENDAPTYANVGISDGIADWRTMKNRLNQLSRYDIPTEFHAYEGLSHGFGIGTGTIADGWINDAIAFWQEQIN